MWGVLKNAEVSVMYMLSVWALCLEVCSIQTAIVGQSLLLAVPGIQVKNGQLIKEEQDMEVC